MAFSNKRNEYNANFTKENYKRKAVNLSREDHKEFTKIIRAEGFSNQAFILYGIELLNENKLDKYIEEMPKRNTKISIKSRGIENYSNEARKNFDIKFHLDDLNVVENTLKERKITLGTLLKATIIYVKNKKDY